MNATNISEVANTEEFPQFYINIYQVTLILSTLSTLLNILFIAAILSDRELRLLTHMRLTILLAW